MTRIATFNVNGINGRLPVLLRWLSETDHNIVCLQELKTSDHKFPANAIREAGYGAIWHGQKSYNGVAILARGIEPMERRRGLPGDPDDTHSRYIEAEVDGIVVGCLYLPNGNPAPGPKFDYKLRWFDRLISYGQHLLQDRVPSVLCGDFNVVPTPIDAVGAEPMAGRCGLFPAEQAGLCQNAPSWLDRCRAAHPSGEGHLHLLELLLPWRLRSEFRPANGPSPGEPLPFRPAAQCWRGRRASQVGEAKRPCAGLDRAQLTARNANGRIG